MEITRKVYGLLHLESFLQSQNSIHYLALYLFIFLPMYSTERGKRDPTERGKRES